MKDSCKKIMLGLGTAAGIAFAVGCPNDSSEEPESCACPDGYAWVCGVIFETGTTDHTEGCTEDLEDAMAECLLWIDLNNYHGHQQQFFSEMCEDMVPETDGETGQPLAPCDGWDPASHVSVNQNVIEIDEALVEAIIDDPSQLVYCDDAIIKISGSSPVYSIDNIRSGDLADELGLLDDDVFYSVNGRSLGTKSGVIEAFLELRLSGETEFTLTVIRGTAPVALNYEIVP